MNVLRCTQITYVSALFLLLLSLLLTFPGISQALSVVPLGDYDNISVLEVSGDFNAFTPEGQVNVAARQAVAREFYRSHGDDYDFLVLFAGFDFAMPPGSLAFYMPVKNDVEGIGQDLFDQSNNYSVDGAFLEHLGGIIDMGPAARHALEPSDPAFDTTLLVMTHEMLHRWGAYVSFLDDGEVSDALLGYGNAHWSFLLDSDGSSLYGNHWQDNGDGTFTSIPPEQAQDGSFIGRVLSPLDRYLMGLAGREDVPPLRLLDSPGIDRNRQPAVGLTIPGMMREIGIEQIVAAEGERFPAAADTSKNLRMAFIYLVAPDTWDPASQSAQQQLVGIRNLQREWATRFVILTGGAASMQSEFVTPVEVGANPGLEDNFVNPSLAPSVSKGVDWLMARQDANGFWQDQDGTAVRDTAAAVAALQPFPTGSAKALTGAAWLSAATAENHDFLARLLLVQTAGGMEELLAAQNSDGGWGGGSGYRSTPLDTALALLALVKNGSVSAAVIDMAIHFLHNTQNPDGGWSSGYGDSLIQPTTYALLALNHYRQNPLYTRESSIADGIDWLIARQNGDGGFGNSLSTVYDTALSLQALKTCGVVRNVTSAAVDYLLAAQSATGSWHGSVFQTALAVEALFVAQVLADLSLQAEDISFSPTTIDVVPASVTVRASVHNLGSRDVSQARVALYAGTPVLGNLIGEEFLDVPGNAIVTAEFAMTVSDFGLFPCTVVLDADGLVAESNEYNNVAIKTLAVNTSPPSIGFEQSTSFGTEAHPSVNLTVRLSHPWPEPVTVNYTVNAASTAVSTSDYLLANGTLTFAPDEVSRTINLTVVNDALAETDKTVVVELGNPSLGVLATALHVYTIQDDEIPAVSINAPVAGLTGISAPLLLYTTTGSSVAVEVDGVLVNRVSGDTLAPLQDGPHFVKVTTTNGLGLSNSARVDFSVDTSLPVVSVVSPKGMMNTSTPLLQYAVAGAVSVSVKLNETIINKVTGQTLDALADGSYTITVSAANVLGATTSVTESFSIDTQPRAVKIRYPYDNAILEETTPPLLYDVLGAGDVTVAVDGVVVSKVSGGVLDALADGEHTLEVVLYDGSGGSIRSEVSFVITTAPVPAMIADPNWALSEFSLWRRSDLNAQGLDGIIRISGLTDGGSYDYYSGSYDYLGNKLVGRVMWSAHLQTDAHALAKGPGGGEAFTSFDGIGGYAARGGRDVYVSRYGKLARLATAYDDYVYDMYSDAAGNVYVAGLTGGYLLGGSGGGISTWVAKFDKDLNFQWGSQKTHNTYADPGNCFLAVGHDGTVYVAGTTSGQFDRSGTQMGGSDYYLARWDASGQYLGAIQSGTSGGETIHGLGADALGNVYLLGATTGAFSGYSNADSTDFFLMKYAENNQMQWVHQWDASAGVEPKSLAVEQDGDLYVLENRIIKKFDRNKRLIWSKEMFATNMFGDGGVDINSSGNLFAIHEASYGDYIYKYIDPRLPTVAMNLPALTNQSSVQINGTKSPGSTVVITSNSTATCSNMQYPSSDSWSCTLENLHFLNDIVVIAKTPEGFRNQVFGRISKDTIPPGLIISSPVNGETYSAKPTISYSTDGVSVAGFLNGIQIGNLNQPLTGLMPGLNLVRLEAYDEAGNVRVREVSFYAAGAAVGEVPYALVNHLQFGTAGSDVVDEVVLDASDNVYVVGTTFGNLHGVSNGGHADVYVSKYDKEGNRLWTRLYGSNNSEYGKGLVVDTAGNIYLLWEVHYASVKGNSQDWTDVVLAKYSANNTLLWSQKISSKARDSAAGVVLDAAGNVWVAGTTEGSLDRIPLAGLSDYYLVKFDSNGNKIWLTSSQMTGNDVISAIASDNTGGVYLTGRNGSGEPFVNRFNASGGVVIGYNKIYSASFPGEGRGLVADRGEHVYVVGQVDPGSGRQKDIFIAKCAGGYCERQELGTTGLDAAQAVSLDSSGNLYLGGFTDGALPGQPWSGSRDAFVAKYDSNLQRIWIKQFGTSSDDEVTAAAADSLGNIYVAGNTSGLFDNSSAGGTDSFLVKLTLPPGPSLIVTPVATPTRFIDQTISGFVSAGATISVATIAPVGSTAVVSPVTQYPDGAWQFTVNGLMANQGNMLTIAASDQNGSASETVAIEVDSLLPHLTVSSLPPETIYNEIALSGTVEQGTFLTVEMNPPSEPLTVEFTNNRWTYPVTLIDGYNEFVFRATDAAGNQSIVSVSTIYKPITVALSRTSLSRDDKIDVVMTIGNIYVYDLMQVEEFVDINNNGRIDGDDPVIRRFQLEDGVLSGNENIPGDEERGKNARVVTTLNYQFLNDIYHLPGSHVFRVTQGTRVGEARLQIDGGSYQQTIGGRVLNGQGEGISGAILQIKDRWDRTVGYAHSDVQGNYLAKIVEPGEFNVIPYAPGYVYDKRLSSMSMVGSGDAANHDLLMSSAPYAIAGRVRDPQQGYMVPGVLVRAENDYYVSSAMSDFSGNYQVSLPSGNYDLSADLFATHGTLPLGYFGSDTPKLHVKVSGNSSYNDILLTTYHTTCTWFLRDQYNNVVSGVPLKGSILDGSGRVMFAVSDVAGKYSIATGFYSPTPWAGEVSLYDDAAQGIGYVGDRFVFSPFDCSIQSLRTYPIDSWITGTVLGSNGQPGANLPVKIINLGDNVTVEGKTAMDGTYHLGVYQGDWDVQVDADAIASEPVAPGHTSVNAGQTSVVNFTISLSPEPLAIAVHPVQSPTSTDLQVISGTMSMGATVSVDVDTAAIVGAVNYPTSTSWECTVSLLAEGGNNITITADDGTALLSVPVVIDYLPPVPLVLTVNPIASPISVNTQVLSGTVSPGATVSIAVNSTALLGEVSYLSTTDWECEAAALAEGLNSFTITANDGFGTLEKNITIEYLPTTKPNTIVITNAAYHSRKQTLTVYATSAYGAAAGLSLEGAGPMIWNSKGARWERVVTGVATKPVSVTVSGAEGSATLAVN